jgi:hypothetical protein
MYKKSGETINHLLLHSEVARTLLNFDFWPLWVRVGYVWMGDGSLCKLERAIW